MSKRKKYQILAWIAVILALTAVAAVVAAIAMIQIGKLRLKSNASSKQPSLNQNMMAVQEEETSVEPQLQEVWEDDWIWYQGQAYDYDENIMTFLCMGIDVDEELSDKQSGLKSGQADALFLLILDSTDQKISILAIDRNTMTQVDTYDKDGNYVSTQYGQIALSHGYGDGREQSAQNTLKSVSFLLYDLPIHGYCAINMAAIPTINDAVGGVDVTVLEDMPKVDEAFAKGARLHLEGDLSYWYVKYRDTEIDESARNRLNRQKQYLIAYVDQAKAAFKKDITIPITLFNAVLPYMTTDITVDEAAYLASEAVNYSFSEENLIMLPGSTDISGRFDEFYVDEQQLREIIVELFYKPVDTSR